MKDDEYVLIDLDTLEIIDLSKYRPKQVIPKTGVPEGARRPATQQAAPAERPVVSKQPTQQAAPAERPAVAKQPTQQAAPIEQSRKSRDEAVYKEEKKIVARDFDDIDDDEGDENTSERKHHFNTAYIPHLVVLAIILIIVVVGVVKLNNWNKSTIHVEENPDATAFATEVLDNVLYVDPKNLEGRPDDGINKVLVMGDYIPDQTAGGESILSKLRTMPNTEWTDITVKGGLVSSNTPLEYDGWPNNARDAFSLYNLLLAIDTKDYSAQEACAEYAQVFQGQDPYEFLEDLEAVDLNEYDTIMLFYSSQDYYNLKALYNPNDDYDIVTYEGALRSTFSLLQKSYPHLRIVCCSPFMTYYTDEAGDHLGLKTEFGSGRETEYVMREFNITAEYCVTFIDNYYYVITEDNYRDYIEGTQLTAKGIDVIANHIIDVMKK